MSCRCGGSEVLHKGQRQRRRAEPAPVTQLVFVTLPPALSYSAGFGYQGGVVESEPGASGKTASKSENKENSAGQAIV
jgi:hypothetical protein